MALLSMGSPSLLAPADWENPAVIGINKRKAHVPLRSFLDSKSATDYYVNGIGRVESSRKLSLDSSDWKFHLFDQPESVPTTVSYKDYDDSSWAEVLKQCHHFVLHCFFRVG